MVHISSTLLSPLNLAFAALVLFLVHRIFFELTTGARRRQLIAEHGCQPVYRYKHEGVLGKLFGIDVMKAMIKSGREGRMQEASRIRNFSNGINTIVSRRLNADIISTIEPENIKAVRRNMHCHTSFPFIFRFRD